MFYPKEIIISEMRFKYKLSQKDAERLYNRYKENNELEIVISLLFDDKDWED